MNQGMSGENALVKVQISSNKLLNNDDNDDENYVDDDDSDIDEDELT